MENFYHCNYLANEGFYQPWSSLVEGGEGSYLPNCQTNLVIALYTLSLLFGKLINTTAYHLGRYLLLLKSSMYQHSVFKNGPFLTGCEPQIFVVRSNCSAN